MSQNSHAKNTYLTYTEGTYPKTYEFATNSQGVLNFLGLTNAAVKLKGDILQPFTDDVDDNYILYRNKFSSSLRSTVRENLSEKAMINVLRLLDVDIQHVHPEGTEEYNTIFVITRSDLYAHLSTAKQLINYKSLSITIGAFPDLAAIKTAFDIKVNAYALIIKAAKDAKSALDAQSILMEAARVKWCIKAQGTTGAMMEIFEETPERVGDIFDVSIFDTRQSHIDPDKGATAIPLAIGVLEVFDGVYDSAKTYQIHNKGFGNVMGGSLPAADTETIPNPLTWLPDETKTVNGAQMGDIMNRFLGFISDDMVLPGEILIKEVVVN